MKTVQLFKLALSVFTVLLSMCITGCQNQIEDVQPATASATPAQMMSRSSDSELPFLQGADLSYINELQDGGVQYTKDGNTIDPYHLIKETVETSCVCAFGIIPLGLITQLLQM